MDFKKSPDQSKPQVSTTETLLPTVNVNVTAPKSKFWGPLYTIGVLGCAFLLFHLYMTTTFHHAVMDHGLHKLEEQVHAMMEMHHHRPQTNVTAHSAPEPPVHGGHGNHAMLDGHVLPHERRHWGTRRSRRKSDVAPVKRGGATFTWFHPGQGACGGHNGDSDFIVAISHLIWNNGAHCGDTITITYEGKSVQATVVDECMGCDPDHIDLSPGLLHHIAGPGTDMVSDGSWSFGVPAPPSPSPKPTPTSTPPPPPPPPSTTSKARPTTTSTSTWSSTSTSSTVKTSSTASSSSTSATATPAPAPAPYVDDGNVHNLIDINVLLINLGGVVTDGLLAQA